MRFLLSTLTLIFVCANASKEDLKPGETVLEERLRELEQKNAELMEKLEKWRTDTTNIDSLLEDVKKPEVMEQKAHNSNSAFIRERSLEESILDISFESPRKELKFVAPEAHRISGDGRRTNYVKIEDPGRNRTRSKSPSPKLSNIFPSHRPDPAQPNYWMTEIIRNLKSRHERENYLELYLDDEMGRKERLQRKLEYLKLINQDDI